MGRRWSWLVLGLMACGPKQPPNWWEGDNGGCPDGAKLLGEPYDSKRYNEVQKTYDAPSQCKRDIEQVLVDLPLQTEGQPPEANQEETVNKEKDRRVCQVAVLGGLLPYGPELWCGTGPNDEFPKYRREGRSMAWHPDGTLREDTLYSKDTIVSGTSWHANGTIDQRIADGEIIRHLWHPDGSRAMEMRYRVGAGRWGRWTEWDEQGVIVGDARYENNALVETMVADSPLVLGPDPFGGQPRSEVALLPVSSSKRPAGLWPRVAIEGNRLSVDGRYVLELVDGKVAEKDRKGEAFIAPLYDQLREAWDAMQAIRALEANPQSQHDLLFLLPADTPFSMVKQLLYTGGQAQFGPMHFASWHPDLQWPPRSGDAEHQGGFVVTAVSVQLPRIRPPTGLSGASPPPPAGGVEIGADTLTLWWPDKEDLVMPCPAPSCSEETLTRLAQTIEGWRVPGQEEMLLSMLPTTPVGIMVPVMAAMHGASTSPMGVVVTGGKYRPTTTPESEKP